MILDELKNKHHLTATEEQLADFICSDPKRVIKMNQNDLASAAYVSPAAISRLAKKMKFRNYNDFRVSLAKEVEVFDGKVPDNNFPFDRNDSSLQIAEGIYRSSVSGLKKLIDGFDEKLIDQISNEICRYKGIDIYGIGSSANNAYLFSEYMTRIGHPCFIHDNFSYLTLWASLDNDHFRIIISHSGMIKDVIKIAELMHEKKKDFLFITANHFSPIVKYAKYVLYMDSGEKLSLSGKLGMFSSQMMECFLLDTIYSCVFVRNYDKSLKQLEETSAYQSDAMKK